MRRTATTIRCVPRFGFENTDVRTIDIDVNEDCEDETLVEALRAWFAQFEIEDAVYGIDYDDNGPFAIINDEAYHHDWGKPVL